MNHRDIDQRVIDLYDEFTHGTMERRDFFARMARLTGGAVAATAVITALTSDYARAQTIAESDPRITTQTVPIPGVQGLSGYLAGPKAGGRAPAVLVIHENRGLNPHTKDVARRLSAEGFLALALDYLSPLGGTPADEDKARELQATLKAPDALAYSRAAIAFLEADARGNGNAGVVGFCWGGAQANALAVAEPALDAAVPFYGRQPAAEQVASIRAPLLLHYAENDAPINGGIAAYEAALKAAGKRYELHMYPGVQHGFYNDTGARYDKAAADLAWSRTLAFFRANLGTTGRS